MAARTFTLHSSLTHFLLLRTRETVPMVTPACFATSLMVAIILDSSGSRRFELFYKSWEIRGYFMEIPRGLPGAKSKIEDLPPGINLESPRG
jgi:hypothetical protein